MIKKIATILVLMVFMLSTVGTVFAQDGARLQVRATDTPKPVLMSVEVGEGPIQARIYAENVTPILIRERFQTLAVQERARFEKLRVEQQRKLARLSEQHISRLAALGEAELKKVAALNRERVRELAQLGEEAIRERLQNLNLKRVRKAEIGKERVFAKQKLNQLRAKAADIKAECDEGHKAYGELKKEFLELRNADPESEETLAKAKELAKKGAENVICHLETTKAHVQAAEELDEERAAAIVEKLDEQIAKFNDLISKLDAAETKEDIIAVAREINSNWQSGKAKARLHTAALLSAKFKGYFTRVNHMENVLERALNFAEENEIDVTAVEKKVNDFNEKVEEARTHYRLSVEKRLEAQKLAREGEDPTEVLAEAREHHQHAVGFAKEANDLLREIIRELKGINVDVEELAGEAEDEVEVVEEEIEGEEEEYEEEDTEDSAEEENDSEESDDEDSNEQTS